jgi:hypothetical protein
VEHRFDQEVCASSFLVDELEGHPDNAGISDEGENPLFPFPDRLSSVFSALGEKANS